MLLHVFDQTTISYKRHSCACSFFMRWMKEASYSRFSWLQDVASSCCVLFFLVPLSNPTLQFLWSVHWSWLDDHHSIFCRWPTASAEERWVCSVTLLSSCKRFFWSDLVSCLPTLWLGGCSGYVSKLAVALRKAALFCRISRAKHETKTFVKMR